jgi:hypothetical protein
VSGLELSGWDVAERAVQPGVVEPANIFDDRELELGAGLPELVFSLEPRCHGLLGSQKQTWASVAIVN